MKGPKVRILWGVLLIVGGVLLLFQSLELFAIGAFLWPSFLGLVGLGFLFVFLTNHRANWWAVIPGFVLLSLAATIILEQLPTPIGEWGGAVFLGGIALAFWTIYLANRENWWAIIPGGVLLTVAAVVVLSSLPGFEGIEVGGVFFLGLGLTFGLLSLLPTPEGQMKWALVPAGVLLIMGALTMAAVTEVLKYIWPLALIFVGLYLLFRSLISR